MMDNRGVTVQSLLRSLMLLGHGSRGGQCAMLNSKRVLPLETPRTKDVNLLSYYSQTRVPRLVHLSEKNKMPWQAWVSMQLAMRPAFLANCEKP